MSTHEGDGARSGSLLLYYYDRKESVETVCLQLTAVDDDGIAECLCLSPDGVSNEREGKIYRWAVEEFAGCRFSIRRIA